MPEPSLAAASAAADIVRLERIGADAWPSATVRTLAGWRLCLDRGATRRANCAMPLGWEAGWRLDAAIAAAESLFAERGLAPCFKISPAALPAGLDHALARRGYVAAGHSLVLTAPLPPAGAAAEVPLPVDLAVEPGAAWVRLAWPEPEHRAPARLAIASRLPPPRVFATVRADGGAAGAGLAAIVDGWAVINALRVRPDCRRRGAGRSLVLAMLGWAAGRGASRAMLQVEADNPAARRLYASLGFRFSHQYHYRLGPAPAA